MKKILLLILSLLCVYAYADTTIKISQNQAWEIVKQKIFPNKTGHINAYVCRNMISANTQIKTLGQDEVSPNCSSWLFFIDDIPFGNWSHPCRYIYVDCNNGKIINHSHSMPPSELDMRTLIEQEAKSEVLLYDSKRMKKQTIKSITNNNTLNNYSSSNNYAVIISGGICMEKNHKRYWNDCAAIYSTLVNVYGYDRNHIYVIMSDGTNPAYDRITNYGYDSSPLDLDNDGTDDIQYAATRTNIYGVFNQLADILTTNNNLFVYTIDHGDIDNNHSFICLWGNEKLYDYEFADLLSHTNANSINICMGQCSSGGFIDDLSRSGYVIATACKQDESSWPLSSGHDGYDAFVYYWTAAVTGAYPDGTITNADTNDDGFVSMREAFNFAVSMDSESETPQFSCLPTNLGNKLNLYLEFPNKLVGKSLIANQQKYEVQQLVTGMSVEWSLSDSYYNQHCLQQNYPAANQCTITRDPYQNMMNATLTAIIKYNGVAIDTLTKTGLYAYNDFYGHYTCDTISGTIDYTHTFYVRPGYSTFISSPNLVNATVSYDPAGTTPLYLFLEPTQWRLSFTTPINNNGVPVILDIDDVLGNHYKLYAMPRGSFYFNIAYGDGYINVTLENDDEKALKTMAIEQPWSYEIRSASMGALKASKSINTRSTTISTVGWPKGVYIIKAKIGKEEITEKIVVK